MKRVVTTISTALEDIQESYLKSSDLQDKINYLQTAINTEKGSIYFEQLPRVTQIAFFIGEAVYYHFATIYCKKGLENNYEDTKTKIIELESGNDQGEKGKAGSHRHRIGHKILALLTAWETKQEVEKQKALNTVITKFKNLSANVHSKA